MKKNILITTAIISLSGNAVACGGDVDMSIPHIHDEQEMLFSVQNSQFGEVKTIDIDDVFSGELARRRNVASEIKKESESNFSLKITQ